MEKVKEVDLCQGCQWAKGLAEGKECHPLKDSDCPANQPVENPFVTLTRQDVMAMQDRLAAEDY